MSVAFLKVYPSEIKDLGLAATLLALIRFRCALSGTYTATQQSLADDCGLSRRQVQNFIKKLVEGEWITAEQPNAHKRDQTTVYAMHQTVHSNARNGAEARTKRCILPMSIEPLKNVPRQIDLFNDTDRARSVKHPAHYMNGQNIPDDPDQSAWDDSLSKLREMRGTA